MPGAGVEPDQDEAGEVLVVGRAPGGPQQPRRFRARQPSLSGLAVFGEGELGHDVEAIFSSVMMNCGPECLKLTTCSDLSASQSNVITARWPPNITRTSTAPEIVEVPDA